MTQNDLFDFGPDPRIEPPELPDGDALAFLAKELIPLLSVPWLSKDYGENDFVKKSEAILRDLWKRTHVFRASAEREKRGRRSMKLSALRALQIGLEMKEHGRAGKPTQGDLERILERRVPKLDEDTRRKYAKLFRLTCLVGRYDNMTERDWIWLTKHDRDFVHRGFFTLKLIRDSAKLRGFLENPNERGSIVSYVALCKALQRLGKPFSAPSYVEVIHFDPASTDQ